MGKMNIRIVLGIPFLAVLMCLCSLHAEAEVRLPRLISSGMVLQRETPVNIWGWASAKETVVVKFQGKSYKTKADKNGNWQITLPAQVAGGSHTMQINDVVLEDILFGDVWVCSGQSNMELPIGRVLDLYREETQNADNDKIRLFHVPLRYSFQQAETDMEGGEWKSVTPDNILNFSALAYFFAKNLHEKYQVPIGLLRSAVGGTPAEAWLSEAALKRDYPDYLEAVRLCTPAYIDSVASADRKKNQAWHNELIAADKGISHWNKPRIDVSDWNTISLPGYWADKGLGRLRGSIWLRKDIDVPASMAGKEATLRLGCIVDSDSAFVNGTFVGTITYQYPPRVYTVPAGLLKEGKNNITIRVVSNSGQGGFVEEKPYQLIASDTVIDLTGDWLYRVGAEVKMPPYQTTGFQNKPMGLFNGMISPLLNYGVKGVIWYQGESNTGRAEEYKTLFPHLINDWRTQWNNPQLPFIYVQLANFMKEQKAPLESGWATLREAQRKTLSLPHTGMAVAIDLGEWNDIHPLNKKEVARRLFLEAQRVAYNETDIVSNGPLLESATIEGNSMILTFSSTGSGLYANSLLKGFAIAGDDRQFVWANAVVIAHNQVKVWSDKIAGPQVVRYAWADNPADANLKNKAGLPASPFSTDNK